MQKCCNARSTLKGDGPIYIAVLPRAALAEAGGSAVGIADELHRILGRRGVYAVVAGNQFRAESTDLGEGKAGTLATAAFKAHHPRASRRRCSTSSTAWELRAAAAVAEMVSAGGSFLILAVAALFVFRTIKRRRGRTRATSGPSRKRRAKISSHSPMRCRGSSTRSRATTRHDGITSRHSTNTRRPRRLSIARAARPARAGRRIAGGGALSDGVGAGAARR